MKEMGTARPDRPANVLRMRRAVPVGIVLPPSPRCLVCGVPRFPPFATPTLVFVSPCVECVYRTGALTEWLHKWPAAARNKAVAFVRARRPFKRPVAVLCEGPEEL